MEGDVKRSGNSGSGSGVRALKTTVNSQKYSLFRIVSKRKCFTNISKNIDGFIWIPSDMEGHSSLYQQFPRTDIGKVTKLTNPD